MHSTLSLNKQLVDCSLQPVTVSSLTLIIHQSVLMMSQCILHWVSTNVCPYFNIISQLLPVSSQLWAEAVTVAPWSVVYSLSKWIGWCELQYHVSDNINFCQSLKLVRGKSYWGYEGNATSGVQGQNPSTWKDFNSYTYTRTWEGMRAMLQWGPGTEPLNLKGFQLLHVHGRVWGQCYQWDPGTKPLNLKGFQLLHVHRRVWGQCYQWDPGTKTLNLKGLPLVHVHGRCVWYYQPTTSRWRSVHNQLNQRMQRSMSWKSAAES